MIKKLDRNDIRPGTIIDKINEVIDAVNGMMDTMPEEGTRSEPRRSES